MSNPDNEIMILQENKSDDKGNSNNNDSKDMNQASIRIDSPSKILKRKTTFLDIARENDEAVIINEDNQMKEHDDVDLNLDFLFNLLKDVENCEIIEEDDIDNEIDNEYLRDIENQNDYQNDDELVDNQLKNEELLDKKDEKENETEKLKENELPPGPDIDNNLYINELDNPNIKDNKKYERIKTDTEIKEKIGNTAREDLDISKKENIKKRNSKIYDVPKKKEDFVEPLVKMKDKKILVNIEDLESDYKSKEKNLFGTIRFNETSEMENLKNETDLYHPRYYVNDKITPYPLCTSMGNFCYSSKKSIKKLNDLGLGILCYFKFLKVLMYCFFIISIINIPLLYVYFTNNQKIRSTSYRDFIFKTTIGNIASTLYNCIQIPSSYLMNNTVDYYKIDFECDGYNITSVESFGLSADNNKDAENLYSCSDYTSKNNINVDSKCDMSKYVNQLLNDKCTGKSNCTIFVEKSVIQRDCQSKNKFDYFYLSYECYNRYIYVGLLNNITIDRQLWGYVIVGIDIGSILILLISMIIIIISQNKDEENYNRKNILISNYTVTVTGILLSFSKIHEELNELIKHFKYVLSIENKDDNKNMTVFKGKSKYYEKFFSDCYDKISKEYINDTVIYDINYPIITDNKSNLVLKYMNLNIKKKNLKKLLSFNDKSSTINPKANKELEKLDKEILKTQEDIKKSNQTELENIKEIFITFRNQKLSKFYSDLYKKNKCTRCCYIFCCQYNKIKHLYYKDKWISVKKIKDEPSNINWQNINFPVWKRRCRLLFSIIIGILITSFSLGIAILNKYAEDTLSQEFNPNVDCSFVKYNYAQVLDEFNDDDIIPRNKILNYCFCYNNFIKNGYIYTNTFIFYENNKKPCESWLSQYIKYNLITIFLIITISLVNIFITLFLDWITNFEKNKTLTKDMTSSMWKNFFLQLINTAIVIILVNMRINAVYDWRNNFPLFTGNFDDFEPSWFSMVGVTIVFTMILNIIVPHISPIILWLYTSCKQRLNRNSIKGDNFMTRKDYFDLYIGPYFNIDTRYSQLLTSMFVVLLFSSGMPLLYITFFLYVFATFWIDKIMMFRFYRKPRFFDLSISKTFHLVVLTSLIFHYLIAIWIYGHPSFIFDNQKNILDYLSDYIKTLFQNQQNNYFVTQIIKRLTLTHNIICIIFALFLTFILIIRITLYNLIVVMCHSCKKKLERKKLEKKNLEIGLALSLKDLYRNYELRKIQYFQLLRKNKENTKSVSLMKKYFKLGINYDREFLKYKIEKRVGKDNKELDKNFDNNIKKIILGIKNQDDNIIVGDVSYNLSFIPEFESIIYYEYLKNFN